MKVVTSNQMRKIDKIAIEEYKIPSLNLMENAGNSVVNLIKSKFGCPENKKIVIFAGKGNNGGDGFVAGRILTNLGAKVKVYLLGKIKEVKGDAKINLERFRSLGKEIIEITAPEDLLGEENYLKEANLIIDAILGTGTTGELNELLRVTVDWLNSLNKPVVSIDIPTGVCADTGRLLPTAIKAVYTVTMGLPKPGLILFPGSEYAGEVVIAKIGFPEELLEDKKLSLNLITEELVKKMFSPRKKDTHKGDYGKIFILAGSAGFTGAAYLCSQSAIRTGAGLVTLGIPASLNDILEVKLTEVMTKPLPETKERTLSLEAEEEILKFMEKSDILAIGPGISQNPETKELIRKIILKSKIPMVIDADGINAIAGSVDILKEIKVPLILTPHPGELSRLINKNIEEIKTNPINIARNFVQEYNAVLVLKLARTVIGEPSGQIYLNTTGNPGMASGGVGDVLTGIIAALLGQNFSPIDSAIAGVYLHGYAGDLAKEKKGEFSLIATDIIEEIPEVLKRMSN